VIPNAEESTSSYARLFPLMGAMFLIGTTEVMAGPMLVDIGRHFGVPSARAAWLSAAHALTYGLLAPLLGPFSDRLGRKALLVPGLLGLAVAAASIPFAPRFELALLAGVFGGLSAAAIQPNALAIVNDDPDKSQLASATSRVFMGLTLSFVLVPPVTGLLAARFDWRAAYFVVAAIAALNALLVARLGNVRGKVDTAPEFLRSYREAFALPGVRRRLAASFLWLGLCIGMSTMLPEIARRRFGLSTESVGLLAGGFGLATVLGNWLAGSAARLGRARLVAVGASASIVGCVVVGVLPSVSLLLALVGGVIWAIGYGAAGPTLHGTLSQLSGRVRGTITALHASLLNLGIMAVAFGAGRYFDVAGVEGVVAIGALAMSAGVALLVSVRENGDEPGISALELNSRTHPRRSSR
jgi:predicted MFS family arabinose efflux permease